MRINSDGNLALVKNIGLGGATPTTSGTGITFPATASASTDANTLDDYEEGTWTPEFQTANTPGTGRVTTVTSASYTKIGNSVFVQCVITMTTLGTGGSGFTSIQGLPFTVAAGLREVAFGIGYFQNLNTNVVSLGGLANSGTTQILITTLSAAGANMGLSTFSTVIKATTEMFISFTYGT